MTPADSVARREWGANVDKQFAARLAGIEDPDQRQAVLRQVQFEALNATTPEALDKAAAADTLLGQRVTLGSLVRDGVPEPSFLPTPSLGERLFYAEHLWIVSGHKKSGKTWAMVAAALDCARAGKPVVYLDLENGEHMFAERLILLGADPEELDDWFHYIPFPRGLSLDTFDAQMDDIAEKLPGAFVVVDSLRGLIARLNPGGRDGLTVNDPQSIERVCAPMMAATKTKGLTVGVIDHAKKGGNDEDEYATANSAAKEQAVDAVYFWTKVEKYKRDVAGVVKIAATSDRRGLLDFERYWRVGGQGDTGAFVFEPVDAEEIGNRSKLDRIREFLIANDGEKFSGSKLAEHVGGNKGDVLGVAKYLANNNPHIHCEKGPRNADLYWFAAVSAADSLGGGLAV